MKNKQPPKVLFFANIPVLKEERSIGGATVLAKNILKFLQEDSRIQIKHQQIRNFWRNKLQLIDYFIWIFRFPFTIKSYDVVSFHGTKDFHFSIAPILWFWAKLFDKKIIYHFFGGNFKEQYQALPKFFQKILLKTILQSDTVFLETKELIHFFEKHNIQNLEWLPNARKPIKPPKRESKFQKRFVFISRIVPQKGIIEFAKAAETLPPEYVADAFGPIDDRHYKSTIFENSSLQYKGTLKPDEILETLINYDVLVLPSYFEGEGYPGIIIEALSLGIPIITTKWKALPEVIQDKYNGRLVEIKNSEQLAEAILHFNDTNYEQYCINAQKSFESFNSDIVFNRITQSYLR